MKLINLIRFFTCLTCMIFSATPGSFSQTDKKINPLDDDIQTKIPPLEVLIDSAIARDPYVSFRNRQIKVNSYKLYADEKQWMRDLGMQADLRYGNYDNLSTNTGVGVTPGSFYTVRTETKYGVGVYISLPIFDLVNRSNQNSLARTEIKQAQDMYEMQCAETRQKVIRQYNDMVVKQRLLKIRSKYQETARVNMLMAEKEFLNGAIPVTEYARLSSITVQAETDYENAKMDFKTAFMILEEFVRMKLNVVLDIQ